MSARSRGPLADLEVLDLTQVLAGPFATMLLADLGADVVKVEPPHGDLARGSRPHLEADEAYGGYFHSVNRNKRSVSIDLKSEAGREAFRALAGDADVVIENFRTGTMEKLGLPYEDLAEANPGLIYASVRGFGDPRTGESPYADRPAYDPIAQAMGGIMSITGTEESGPTKVGPGVGDIFPGVLAAVGILSAVHHRERTGEGQYVDVGMVDGVLSLCERIVHQFSCEGEVPRPQGSSHPFAFPFDRFEAADGYFMITAFADHQWEALCEHMGRPDLAEAYEDRDERSADADRLFEIVNEWTLEHTRDELFDLLADDVPCGPVNTVADVFADPHFEARRMLREVEHADTGRTITVAGTPVKMSENPDEAPSPAPFLGEHTRDVLAAHGFDEGRIEELYAAGAVADETGDDG